MWRVLQQCPEEGSPPSRTLWQRSWGIEVTLGAPPGIPTGDPGAVGLWQISVLDTRPSLGFSRVHLYMVLGSGMVAKSILEWS